MQERIIGTEYIVNTVSCNGRHRVASIWQYDKVKMANGTNAYNYAQTVNRLDVGHSRLVSYAFDVLDAIGIKYGPVHGEFMIDEHGPVLIEVNCRPMGGGMSRKFVEQLFGHHETDCALDAYLNPDKFEEEMNKPYRPLRKGAMKFFILPRDVAAETTPIVPISKRLKSFHKGLFDRVGRELLITQTKNLETTGGMVYLIHPDEQVVIDECNLLHTIEMKYPDILFQQNSESDGFSVPRADIAAIMKEMRCGGGTLVFSDTDVQVEGATVISEKELRDAYDSYEQGILDLSKPETFADLEIVIRQIYEFADKIRENGRIIIVDSLETAAKVADEIAPEHLEVCVDDPFGLLPLLNHAGSIFLGRNCPEPLGDYLAGPNHTLPTSGTARYSSPLGVDDFCRRSSYIYYTQEALADVAEDVMRFAEREGLGAHANAVRVRVKE